MKTQPTYNLRDVSIKELHVPYYSTLMVNPCHEQHYNVLHRSQRELNHHASTPTLSAFARITMKYNI